MLSNLIYKKKSLDLINFNSKINIITLRYVLKLSLKVRLTNVKEQKIDGFTIQTFEIVLASCYVKNKLERPGFIKKRFY